MELQLCVGAKNLLQDCTFVSCRVFVLVAFMFCIQAREEMKQTRLRSDKQSRICVCQRAAASRLCHIDLIVFCLLGEQICRQ